MILRSVSPEKTDYDRYFYRFLLLSFNPLTTQAKYDKISIADDFANISIKRGLFYADALYQRVAGTGRK